MMFLTDGTTSETITKTAGEVINEAGEAVPALLNIGTAIFNWAIQNPIYVLGLILFIIFVVAKLVKKFSN